jgi:hypothetical protein
VVLFTSPAAQSASAASLRTSTEELLREVRGSLKQHLVPDGAALMRELEKSASAASPLGITGLFVQDLPRAEVLLRSAATRDHAASIDSSRKEFARVQPRSWSALSCALAKLACSRLFASGCELRLAALLPNEAAQLQEAASWLHRSAAAGQAESQGVLSGKIPWFAARADAGERGIAIVALYWTDLQRQGFNFKAKGSAGS